MAELTTLCALKPFLRLSNDSTQFDVALKGLISAASDWVEAYCYRKFAPAEWTEFYCGNGTQQIVLNQTPVASIESVYVDSTGYWGEGPDAFAADKLLVEGVDYALKRDSAGISESGILYRINDMWRRPAARFMPPGVRTLAYVPQALNGNVKVTYTAGYSPIPGPVVLAVHTACARLWQSGRYGAALKSESYEDYSYDLATMNPDDLLGPSKPFLSLYRKVVV